MIVFIYEVTDDCDQRETCSSTFSVAPASDLTVECPDDVNIPECTSAEEIQDAFDDWLDGFSHSGGCDPQENALPTTPPDECDGGMIVFEYEVTDDCDQRETCSSTFSVAPAPDLMVECPDDVNIPECTSAEEIQDAFDDWLDGFSHSGGCDPQENALPTTPPDECDGGMIVFIYEVTDDCDQRETCSSTFSVAPAPDLTVECPDDVNIPECTSAEEIQDAFDDWLDGFSHSGGCDPQENALPTTPPDECDGGSVVFTYVVEDRCGQRATCSSTFSVTPAPPVQLSCPDDDTVDGCLSQSEIDDLFEAWKDEVTYGDGCDPELSVSDEDAPPACEGGSVVVTFTVTDNCETTSCTATFSVTPAPPVQLSCSDDDTVDGCLSQSEIDDLFEAWKDEVTYGDGCDPELSVSDEDAPPACEGGSVVVTFTVTDNCETTSCTATFSVTPAPPVQLSCPDDDTVDGCLSQSEIDDLFEDWKDEVTYGDGCDPELSVSDEDAPPACEGGSVVVTFTVTDNCETTSCTATFSVTPAPPVQLSCPDDDTVDGCLSQSEIDDLFEAWKDEVTYGDGCDPELSVSDEDAPPACEGGSVVVTFTVTDNCETTSCTATFSVAPAPPVQLSCPDDDTVDGCLSQSEIDDLFEAWKDEVTYGDGCDPELSVSDEDAPPACEGGSVVVTFTVTDNCETTSCTATFSVTPAPEIQANCPAPVTIEACTSQSEINTAFSNWKAQFGASGGCDASGTDLDDFEAPNACIGGTVTINFEANGLCGSDGCTSTFTVIPAPPLELTCPSDMTIEACTSQGDINTAFENWKNSVTFDGGCNRQSNVTEQAPPDACNGGSVVITFAVTDDCGSSSCTATFSVEPAPPIQANCPAPVVIDDCSSQAEINTAFAAWKAQFGVSGGCDAMGSNLDNFIAPDVCDGGVVTIDFGAEGTCSSDNCTSTFTVPASENQLQLIGVSDDVTVSCDIAIPPADVQASSQCSDDVEVTLETDFEDGLCPVLGVTIYTWTAVDECGNVVSASQRVTRVDDADPVLEGVPDDVTVDCDNIPDIPTVTAFDFCSEIGDPIFEEIRTQGSCGYTITRTWTATDACNQTVTESQVITVEDNDAPVLPDAPDDLSVSCASDIPNAPDLTANDACQGLIQGVLSEQVIPGTCPNKFTLIRRWSFDDGCGNVADIQQTIEVNDDTPPVWTNLPDDLVVNCDDNISQLIQQWLDNGGNGTATDNCGNVSITNDYANQPLSCNNLTVDVVFSATDECGNETTASASIIFIDNTPPVIQNPPSDLVLECETPVNYEPIWLDNCSTDLLLSAISSISIDGCETSETFTYFAEDECGNSASVSFSVRFVDTTPPVLSIDCPLEEITIECGIAIDPLPTP